MDSHTLAEGFHIQARDGKVWALLLRYQAQAERQYRRAVEEFDCLRRDFPNEPISVPEPEESRQDTAVADEPISAADEPISAADEASPFPRAHSDRAFPLTQPLTPEGTPHGPAVP
jgi:hypothetical protein